MTFHVADVMLIAPTNARRVLTGLACATGERIGLTPEVVISATKAIGNEAARRESQRLGRHGHALPPSKSRCIKTDTARWFADYARDPEGPFTVVCDDAGSQDDAERIEASLPDEAFVDRHANAADSDRRIVAEALAGGADMVLTNNMRSINHAVVNDWCAKTMGRNSPFMANASAGMQQVLLDADLDALGMARAALAMCVSDEPRPADEEWHGVLGILSFAEHQLEYVSYAAQNVLMPMGSGGRFEEELRRARELRRREPWRHCRESEAARVGIVRSGGHPPPPASDSGR